MPKKKVIIAGVGHWSKKMHLPAMLSLVESNKLEVVGVCDLNIAEAIPYANQLNCNLVLNNLDELIDQTKPDGAVLLVPPKVMPVMIQKCLNHHLKFLCEKPPAPDAATHKQLLEMSKNLPHIVGYNRRFSPFINQALKWSENKRIDSINCDFSRVSRIDEDFSTTFIHGIDAVIYLSRSQPQKIYAEIQYKDKYENIFLFGNMQNECSFFIRIMPNTASSQERYQLRGDSLSIDISFSQGISIDSPGYAELHQKDTIIEHKSPIDYQLKHDDFIGLGGFTFEYQAFYDLLNGANITPSTLASTYSSQVVRDQLCFALSKKETKIEMTL